MLKEIYDTGRYGKLLSGEMERLGCYPKWSWDGWMMDEPRSGFVPFDLHIHDLDFVVYAFGAPVKVDHFRSKQKDQDFLHAVYSYPDFFISAEASWFAAPYPFHMSFRFQFEEAVVAYEGAKLSIYQRDGKVVCPFDDTDAAEFSQLPQSSGYLYPVLRRKVLPLLYGDNLWRPGSASGDFSGTESGSVEPEAYRGCGGGLHLWRICS